MNTNFHELFEPWGIQNNMEMVFNPVKFDGISNWGLTNG